MTLPKAVIVDSGMITPFGDGIEASWQGLLAGRTAVSPLQRFATEQFGVGIAATVAGLEYHGSESLAMQMLTRLAANRPPLPAGTPLVLATTKGEIDLLEKELLSARIASDDSRLDRLLAKTAVLFGASAETEVISAACTSSAVAVARAASMIRSGRRSAVLVVATDAVTEFVYAGFASLMALDKVPARPFDRHRQGLSVGEAAACVLLMSAERAVAEGRSFSTEVAGWGMSDDANHMTGPSRESEGLIRALRLALASASLQPEDIGFVAAHGTGTGYNDAMELNAFRQVFPSNGLPVYSVKGAVGHTMGAAGLLELLLAERALSAGMIPPTVNLQEPVAEAVGMVSTRVQPVAAGKAAMVTNAGFSGVNTAVVLWNI